VRCHPDHPRRGPDQQIPVLVPRRSGSCLASPLEACPLPQDLSAFLGVFPAGQLRSANLGYWSPCWLKPPTSRAWDGPGLCAWLWPVELRAGLGIDAQAARVAKGRPLVMGKASDYHSASSQPGPGPSARNPVTGSAMPCVAPWWCAQRQRRQVGGPWQGSEPGGGMLCERLSSRPMIQ